MRRAEQILDEKKTLHSTPAAAVQAHVSMVVQGVRYSNMIRDYATF